MKSMMSFITGQSESTSIFDNLHENKYFNLIFSWLSSLGYVMTIQHYREKLVYACIYNNADYITYGLKNGLVTEQFLKEQDYYLT